MANFGTHTAPMSIDEAAEAAGSKLHSVLLAEARRNVAVLDADTALEGREWAVFGFVAALGVDAETVDGAALVDALLAA